jgi:hypothetical protein
VRDTELVPMDPELVDVKSVTPLGGYNVRLVFSDGVERIVDLDPYLRGPIFESVRDQEYFRKVRVDKDTGTVGWPNGADIDPIVLRYDLVPAWMEEERAEAQAEAPRPLESFRTAKDIRPFGGRRTFYVFVILGAGTFALVLAAVAGLLSERLPPSTALAAIIVVLLTQLVSIFLWSYLQLRLQRQSQLTALTLLKMMDNVSSITLDSDGQIQVVASSKASRTEAATTSRTRPQRANTESETQ